MHKAQILLVLSLWTMIIPYTGFPYSWKDVLTTLTGIVFVYFSYTYYVESRAKEKKRKIFDNFKENANFDDDQNDISASAVEEIDMEILEKEPAEYTKINQTKL